MTIERLKSRVLDHMDQNADVIKGIGEDIFQHPELGYKETRTAGIVAKALSSLDLPVTEGLGITGVSAKLDTVEIEIEEIPGYLPRRNYPAWTKMMNTSPCGSGLRPASSKV